MTSKFNNYVDFVKQLEAKRMDKLDRVVLYLVRSFVIKTWLTDPDTTLFHMNNRDLSTVKIKVKLLAKVYKYTKVPIDEIAECLEYMPDLGLFNSYYSDSKGSYFILNDELYKFMKKEFELFKILFQSSTREVIPLSLIKVAIYFIGLSVIQNITTETNKGVFTPTILAHTDIGLDLKRFNSRRQMLMIDNVVIVEQLVRKTVNKKISDKVSKRKLIFDTNYKFYFKHRFTKNSDLFAI